MFEPGGEPASNNNSDQARKYVFTLIGNKIRDANIRPTKHLQQILQALAVMRAAFEVQSGNFPCGKSDSLTGIKLHANKKHEVHFDAYARHCTNLLVEIKGNINVVTAPTWLTYEFLISKGLPSPKAGVKKVYSPGDDHLWSLYERVNREVKSTYLTAYWRMIKENFPSKKLPSGKIWLEFLEKFREVP